MDAILINELLRKWSLAKQKLQEAKPIIEEELALRKALFNEVWANPREGVNKLELLGGQTLSGTHKLDRKVDAPSVPALRQPLAAMSVRLEDVFEYVPRLKLRAYKELTAEAKAVVDTVLTTTPGAPQLEITEKKRKG